mmetsp:Transcript_1979/g.2075  ORF Transcript_1979/g.2075 Transcript_1979/m.2075 type:complete len:124 (-) Transcript_1979:147-518(-)
MRFLILLFPLIVLNGFVFKINCQRYGTKRSIWVAASEFQFGGMLTPNSTSFTAEVVSELKLREFFVRAGAPAYSTRNCMIESNMAEEHDDDAPSIIVFLIFLFCIASVLYKSGHIDIDPWFEY